MAEYIEREAAVKIAERYSTINGTALGRHSGVADCIASEIARLPAADVVPVVRGKWINTEPNYKYRPRCSAYYKCSECGRHTGYKQIKSYKFCPKCGSKMEGGVAHETD